LQVGTSSIIAAGSYVEENAVVPDNEVWAGSPAKKLRDIKPAEKDYLRNLPARYRELSGQHQEIMEVLSQKQHDFAR
jgi:carbonic anhydrase/acetyltransferase-like protein (isoleucine patch superfamily)